MKIFLGVTFIIAAAFSAWFLLSGPEQTTTIRPEISDAKKAKIAQRADAIKADLSVDEENARRLKEMQEQLNSENKRN